jgi:hypothetical protein
MTTPARDASVYDELGERAAASAETSGKGGERGHDEFSLWAATRDAAPSNGEMAFEDRRGGLRGRRVRERLAQDDRERQLGDGRLALGERKEAPVADERARQLDPVERSASVRRYVIMGGEHEELGAVGVTRRQPRERPREQPGGRGPIAGAQPLVQLGEAGAPKAAHAGVKVRRADPALG